MISKERFIEILERNPIFTITKYSKRKDLSVFLILSEHQNDDRDIICNATHDKVYFSIDVDKLIEVISEENADILASCGVMYEEDEDCLTMFV